MLPRGCFNAKNICSLIGAGGLSFEPKYQNASILFKYFKGHSKDSMKDIHLEFQNSAHSDLSLRDIQKCLAILPKQDQKQAESRNA